ncbi:tRNA synthetases class I, catalytic domain-containing protein [Lipomyces doorenjongii]|uniref:tRNA synthetases class I, catalytic domain-containing protein n=1 Tax=Lipomyces doorenjongii TaxID=383834 RepID=UPI0034CE104E
MTDENEVASKLAILGLTDQKLNDVLKNKKLAFALASIVQECGAESALEDKSTASLLQSLGTATKDIPDTSVLAARSLVTNAVVVKKIKSNIQLEAAVAYIKSAGEKANSADLDIAAGVGQEVTPEMIDKEVATYFAENSKSITANRYKSIPSLMAGIKKLPGLKWAPPAEVKKAIDRKLLDVLGPKDERDAPPKKSKMEKAAPDAATVDEPKKARNMFTEGFLGDLHKPGGNPQIKPELMTGHLKATNGIVVTRFPPEPNGYLHIGHSKAIAVNFGYAKYHSGICYLRYDDTNPEAEEERYFTAILEIIEWLGFTPYKITYSSDHFQRLYDLAEELIRRDKGYVCFCTPEQVHENRGGDNGGARIPCKHRSKPIEQSLDEFRAMRDGKYNPGEATLRMKMDLEDPNPQMWDLVAYRVLNAPHHRTGDKWKVYPTYDFTHCLCDSFENISHSLCTTEFYLSRQSYEWLCDALEIYKPAQREYGRLNITGTIMSKRKIARLVKEGFVSDWDDPRLFTLVAIRRRGVPPEAILSFVNELGVTTTNSNIQVTRFETSIRRYLEDHTPRLMLIPDPVLLILDNVPDDYVELIALPYKPGSPELGEHNVPFTKRAYIDRSDFREQDSEDYFRLAPGKSVGLLKVPYTVRVTSFRKDESGKVTEIHAIYENDRKIKPKTYIQWVGESPAHNSPVSISEVRMFNRLFLSESPESNPDGFIADINPNSLDLYKDAVIEVGFDDFRRKNVKEGAGPESMRFQALRVGYFCIDRETTEDSVILNRIVTLKEDAGKSSA